MRRSGTAGKRFLPLSLFLAAAIALVPAARAQVMTCTTDGGARTCAVQQGFGTLNEAIHGDTTATGERIDANTIYVLERGGLYLLNGAIENQGYHLRIQAAEGDGHPPMLQPGVSETGESDLAFSVRGDLSTTGLYLTHLDDAGGLQQRMYRVRADGLTVRLDGMFLDTDGQSIFRTDGVGSRIFIENSHIRNSVFLTSPDNGRIIDTRGNSADTLWFANNTLYHYSQDIIRAAGAILPFVHFDHNTVYNGGESIDLERAVKVVITNNLFINPSTDWTEEDLEGGVEGFIELDSLRAEGLTEQDRSIVIRNNNYFYDEDWTAFFNSVDTIMVRPMLNPAGQALVDANANFIVENNISSPVSFTDAPESATYIAFRNLRITDPTNENPPDFRADRNGVFDELGMPLIGIGELPYDFDFSYATSDESYTAAEGGFPLGDLNWFPDRKADWIATDVDDVAELPSRLALHGNYPNPFNPSTTIFFDLNAAAEVGVAVYDLLGRQVLEVPAQALAAGQGQQIRVDAYGLASGVYLYQVTAKTPARTEVSNGRMVLLK